MIRHKVHITAFFNGGAGRDFTRAMRAITISWRLPYLLKRCRRGGMIHMGMGNQNMGDRLACERLSERCDVLFNHGPRVDDGNLAMTDDIGACAVKGKSRGVARGHAANKR